MNTAQTDLKKECLSCLYLATHEQCGKIGSESYCLGQTGESNQYKNWVGATVEQALARQTELERNGKRSIVIGGIGEAEVSTNDTPEQAFEQLVYVAEQCGYVVSKGAWHNGCKEIFVWTDAQHKLTYISNKLSSIIRGHSLKIWTA